MPKTEMSGLLCTIVEGLNDNWSVQLADYARPWPNHRGLPVRDGRAYAQLDLSPAEMDLFIGHPVVCDNPNVKVLVSWQQPGVWFVEAHNPTDKPLHASLETGKGWELFDFRRQVELPTGSSRVWNVKTRQSGAEAPK